MNTIMNRKIIDINGKERTVKSIKKIVHQVQDVVTGNMIDENFVEVVIIGQHRKGTWKEWYPLNKFIELNPNIRTSTKR